MTMGDAIGTSRAASVQMFVAPWLRRYMGHLQDLPRDLTRNAAIEMAQRLEEEARRNLRVGGPRGLRVRTGRLRDQTRVVLRDTPQGATAELRTLFYGLVNARGAVITPKRGPYLVFRTARGWVRAKRVVIPARDWDVAAAETVRREFPRFLTGAVTRLRT